jgi:hypothetical protein
VARPTLILGVAVVTEHRWRHVRWKAGPVIAVNWCFAVD